MTERGCCSPTGTIFAAGEGWWGHSAARVRAWYLRVSGWLRRIQILSRRKLLAMNAMTFFMLMRFPARTTLRFCVYAPLVSTRKISWIYQWT